jgi:outer membrane protein TolC
MFTTTQSNGCFEVSLTEGGGISKKKRIQINSFEYGFKWAFSITSVLRLKSIQHILIICSMNVLFFNSLKAQLDTSHIYVDTMSRADLDPIQNSALTLRSLNELTELAILNAPELKNNQVEYARQAMVVKLQKRAWLDNISINTASLYGNGTIVDASNNGTTTAYALSDRKSLNFNVGVGVRISGGDILNRGTKVEIQRIQLEKVQNDRLIVESRIRETVINIYTQLELALKIVKLRGDVVENQRLALTIADKYFQEGKYKPTDYGTLLDKITAAQEQYEQAKSEAKKLALLLKNIVNVSVWK